MNAPTRAPMLPDTTMSAMFNDEPGCMAWYAAGGMTSSDGNGMNELSIAINKAIVQ